MLNKEKNIRPDIEGEMDELQRVSQDLKRDEDIDISVDELVKAFGKSREQKLTNDVWFKLENTESNQIKRGEWSKVMDIAKNYNKTNPKKLKSAIESGNYNRPLILDLGGRYILVAGNTRLSTAAAMGVTPMVFIARIYNQEQIEKLINIAHTDITRKKGKEYSPDVHELQKWINDNMYVGDINEKWSEKYKKSIDCNNPKGFSQRAHCQGRKKKTETKESMGADSAGAFSAPAFSGVIKKKDLYKSGNYKKYNVNEEEVKEATDASSSGAYDAPFGDGGKNPLKINGPESIKKSRAVKDKNFPKWGGPGGIFIKIKEKCKKYPYCNQGDINAIELLEIKNEVVEISEKYGIPYKEMEKIVLNEINKIFISMNLSDINSLIESIAKEEVKNMILSESENNKKEVYHIKLEGEPIETFKSREEAEKVLPKYQEKEKGELIIEPEVYESYEDMIEKMDLMGQELEEKENQNMENQEPMEGNAFAYAALKAKESGKKSFKFKGKEHDVEEAWKQLEEEEGMCYECGDKSMEEKLVGNQDKLDKDKDGKITKKDFDMLRDVKEELDEEKKTCNECGSMLNEEGMCSECGSMMNESKTKKRTIRLTESEMVELIKKMVKESIPGVEVTKKAQSQSKKDNEDNAKNVGEKISKATKIEGSDNPEFPHQNNSGTKVARQNNEEENEFVEDNRGGKSIDLDYDHEPSDKFKKRLKSALEGDSTMGNSQEAANVVKSDLGKKLAKQAERKGKKDEEAPRYKKEPQPVKEVNESEKQVSSVLKEEIQKMKKIASYNKKTQ